MPPGTVGAGGATPTGDESIIAGSLQRAYAEGIAGAQAMAIDIGQKHRNGRS